VSDTLRFSVIVTTFNRRRLLRACLDALLAQEGTPEGHEIVVVDDGGRDGTAGLLRSLAGRVHALRQPNRGWAAARNSGAQASRGDLLVFLDDDCLAPPDWLRCYAAAWEAHPEAEAVAGRVACAPGANLAGKVQYQGHVAIFDRLNAAHGSSYHAPGPVTFGYGANRSIRRAVFERLGGFDERLRYFEDLDLDLRLQAGGGRVWYDPDIFVNHCYRLSAWGRLRAAYYYGRSAVRFSRLHPDFVDPGGDGRGWLRVVRSFPEEPAAAKAGYLLVTGLCRGARSLGRLAGSRQRGRGGR
jgi:GT2 family glycosyltransferase